MSRRPEVGSELSRDLSLFHVTMMGMGMMIGAGVFLGTGAAIAYTGPGGVLLTFALNGLVAILTAMSYAELSSAIPHAGGAYNFARVGFGRGTSFVAGWMEWFASSVAGALYAVCCATYLVRFLNGLGLIHLNGAAQAITIRLVALGVAGVFLYINYRGASDTGKVGALMTLAQTCFLLFIGAVGAFVVIKDPARLANFSPFLNAETGGWAGLLVTMGFTSVAFEGFEVIAQAGDETIDPRRNIPKAMLYSVLFVTVTYVVCAFAVVAGVKGGPDLMLNGEVVAPWVWIGAHGGEGFGAAVELLLPHGGRVLVVLGIIAASTSALNATLFSATRVSYALGRDRMLPGIFARISQRTRTPWGALLATGAIVLVVAGGFNAEQVAGSASIMFLLLFFLVNLCVIRIRYNMGDELQYGFIMPFFPLLPVIAIITQAVLAVFLHKITPVALIIAPAWIAGGICVYLLYSRSRAVTTESEVTILEEQGAMDGDEYRVMVAVANTDNALSLVRSTYAICRAKQARVELVHVVPVPEQVPLSDAGRYMVAGKEAIGEVMLYMASVCPFSSTMRYCRNAARGIVSAVRERKANLLIMGWHGKRAGRVFTLGSTVDPILERVPCDVAIMKNCGDQQYKRVLVPVSGGPNALLALEMAGMLVARDDGHIFALNVDLGTGSRDFDLDALLEQARGRCDLPHERVHPKTVKGANVVASILAEAEREDDPYDLVVLGATREPVLAQLTRESVPERVARFCDRPLIMVQSAGRLRSWIRRWI